MPALAPSSAHGVLEANNDDDGKPKHRAPAACMVVQRKKSWAHARNRNTPLMLPYSWSGLAGLAMLTLSRHQLEPGKGAQCQAPDGISGGLKGLDWGFSSAVSSLWVRKKGCPKHKVFSH